jgi:hypothetical protein
MMQRQTTQSIGGFPALAEINERKKTLVSNIYSFHFSRLIITFAMQLWFRSIRLTRNTGTRMLFAISKPLDIPILNSRNGMSQAYHVNS